LLLLLMLLACRVRTGERWLWIPYPR
jgi:hypothetical protein